VIEEDLEWADLVVVMENTQRAEIGERLPKAYLRKRIVNLDIPDIFSYNQPELRELLREKMHGVEPSLEL